MQSEVMGKTLAMFMVIAMVTTMIVAFSPNVTAVGDTYITGKVLSANAPFDPIVGATVDYFGINSGNKSTTITQADGTFDLYVFKGIAENYTLNFTMIGFEPRTVAMENTSFVGTSSDTGTTLMEPQSVVKGTVYELDTTTPISGVRVDIGEEENTLSDSQGRFSPYTSKIDVDVTFYKDGYYSSSVDNVNVDGTTYDDVYYMEKITPVPTVKVWGVVSNSTETQSDALVSISEGEDKWITTRSDENGYYEVLAYPGNYQIKASKNNFFTTFDDNYFFTVPTEGSVRQNIVLENIDTIDRWFTGDITCDDGEDTEGAVAYLYSSDGKYVAVNNTITGVTGNYNLSFYADTGVTFTLVVEKEGYFTNFDQYTGFTAGSDNNDVVLYPISPDYLLSGFVYDIDGDDIIDEATVTIYSNDYLYTNTTTTAENGYYEFWVNASSDLTIVVDAEGYQSEVKETGIIDENTYLEVGLYPSKTDHIQTKYTFIDWNTIQVQEFKTLNVDNITARYNADRKWGMGPIDLTLNDGYLSTVERQEWATYLEQKGAEQRDTADFLTLDNLYYELGNSTYTVTIEGAEGVISAVNTTIYINGTYNYTLVGELEDAEADTFQLEFNSTYDSIYENFIYKIYIPNYEMTENITETNNVEVTGYNNPITIDPAIFDEEMEEITMIIERSMNGTAMASIVSGDHYYVVNSTYDNYTVIVAQGGSAGFDTTVTFSAEDSTDLIGDINKANFTWDFGDGEEGWGMEVEHNFSAVSGDVTVNLTVVETGGNDTYRDLFVKVDGEAPSASISVITTDSENVSVAGGVLTVNEDTLLTFSGVDFNDAEGMGDQVIAGGASADEIEDGDGNKGTIEKWFWSWGEEDAPDETITMDGSNNITHAYTEPGTYYLNLITTDVVGHESATANWTVNVIDMTAPVPEFKIEDNGTTVIEVVEDVEYIYNASLSTDNIDDVEDLTFSWIFEIDDVEYNYTGEIISFTFSMVGTFNVTLFATDTAGNEANSTQIVHVNLGERPNILMKVGSMIFDPEDGTAGSAMKISVNLTNDGEVDATNIQVTFYIKDDDGDTEIGTTTISTLAVDEDIEASITWKPGKKGDYSIWANATCAEEHDSQYWDNSIDDFSVQTVTIAEASWVIPAIVMGIIAVIVVVFFGFRYFMQRGIETDKDGEKRKKK